jgi:hypothetical protein
MVDLTILAEAAARDPLLGAFVLMATGALVSRLLFKQQARNGLLSGPSRHSIKILIVACMPGFSKRSGLGALMTMSVIAACSFVCGDGRICVTVPEN